MQTIQASTISEVHSSTWLHWAGFPYKYGRQIIILYNWRSIQVNSFSGTFPLGTLSRLSGSRSRDWSLPPLRCLLRSESFRNNPFLVNILRGVCLPKATVVVTSMQTFCQSSASFTLQYIPLNWAIVTEVYRANRTVGRPIPRTTTQVYIDLTLTLDLSKPSSTSKVCAPSLALTSSVTACWRRTSGMVVEQVGYRPPLLNSILSESEQHD